MSYLLSFRFVYKEKMFIAKWHRFIFIQMIQLNVCSFYNDAEMYVGE